MPGKLPADDAGFYLPSRAEHCHFFRSHGWV